MKEEEKRERVEVDTRLSDIERRWIEGWTRGIMTRLGIPEKEQDRKIREKMPELVELAKKWKKSVIEAFTR